MQSHNPIDNFHAMLASNCPSQSQALLQGKSEQEAFDELIAGGMDEAQASVHAKQKAIPGNRPSNTLYFPRTTTKTLDTSIALYLHNVAAQGMIQDVNSFAQWGGELAKQLVD